MKTIKHHIRKWTPPFWLFTGHDVNSFQLFFWFQSLSILTNRWTSFQFCLGTMNHWMDIKIIFVVNHYLCVCWFFIFYPQWLSLLLFHSRIFWLIFFFHLDLLNELFIALNIQNYQLHLYCLFFVQICQKKIITESNFFWWAPNDPNWWMTPLKLYSQYSFYRPPLWLAHI